MKFHITILVLLIASSLRVWIDNVLVLADQAPRTETGTAAQTAGWGLTTRATGADIEGGKGYEGPEDGIWTQQELVPICTNHHPPGQLFRALREGIRSVSSNTFRI